MTEAPYGSWTSPITAADFAAGAHPVTGAAYVGDEIWWLELRAAEAGRQAVRRVGADGEPADVLPAPWNARTRVHEYGGGSWVGTPGGELVFTEFTDQRLYRLERGARVPVPLTPEPAQAAGLRYGDLRLGPDGTQLAWIAWEHPQMPWDGTELRVAALDSAGVAGEWRTLLGSTTESVLQPSWIDDHSLLVGSDRSGFWNLYRVPAGGGDPAALHPLEADFSGPLWELGTQWYDRLDATQLLVVHTFGTDTLGTLDLATGALADLDLGEHTTVRVRGVRGREVLLVTGGALVPTALRRLDLDTGVLTVVRASGDQDVAEPYLPQGRAMTFTGTSGREVHAIVYPPRSPDFTAPAGELPPYVALVHGGPTGRVAPELSVHTAYFTSRGIGVVDVNYGGSTGYGREYRNRLRGQWGIVDVEDTIAAVLGLAGAGLADRDRLAIQGGSAGGWTVLSALTGSDVFACGVSYFGVAELIKFAEETHDFESRYLDGLIGPLPEARELYETRAPTNNVAGLSCPVLLLQGLDDPVVPPSQAERFRDALLEKQLPHAYLTYAGESHGFRKRETIIDSLEAELSFYGQILGFEPPGVPKVEIWRP